MRKSVLHALGGVALVLAFLAGSFAGHARPGQPDEEGRPLVYAWGNQVTVYYPAQKKLYVYSELGGNCVYVYTLSAPGAPITRENCR